MACAPKKANKPAKKAKKVAVKDLKAKSADAVKGGEAGSSAYDIIAHKRL
jgi:hypothetical protein